MKYIEQLYREVHDNRYDLEVLQGMLKSIDKHEDHLCELYCLIKDRVDILLDYEKQFNQSSSGNRGRGITVIGPDGPIICFKTVKEAAKYCNVSAKSASNCLQNKQETAGEGYSFKYADEL